MIKEKDRFLYSSKFLYVQQYYETVWWPMEEKNIWDINYKEMVNIFST